MHFYLWIVIIALTIYLNHVLGFIAQGMVESVSIVPLESNKTNSFGPVAKVSRLFHVKKLKGSPSQDFSSSGAPFLTAIAEELKEDRSLKIEPALSSRFIEKIPGDQIYNRNNNPFISSESWKDLNTVLSENEMKEFLTSLPLHTLRNLTSMTRKNPELGQKQLVRMILDRSSRFKNNISEQNEISDMGKNKKVWMHKTKIVESDNTPTKDSDRLKEPDSLGKSDPSKHLNVLERKSLLDSYNKFLKEKFQTTTTTFPVLEPPVETLHSTTAPSSEIERKKGEFPLLSFDIPVSTNSDGSITESYNKNSVPARESPRLINSFNGGYFIPHLTSDSPQSTNQVDLSQPSQFSWNFEPQDPENTFQPNIDKFLKPPHEFDIDTGEIQSESSSSLAAVQPHSSSSSVWVPTSSLQNSSNSARNNNENHPFSGFHSMSEAKLQSAASNEHINGNNGYGIQHPGYPDNQPEYPQTSDEGVVQQDQQNQAFQYSHSTLEQHRPLNSHNPSHSYPPPNSNNYKQNSNSNSNHQNYNNNNNNIDNSNYDNKNKNNNQNHHQQQNFPSNSPSNVENNPGYYGNSWSWGNQNQGIWSMAQSYFNKGGKSTSELVFEISIAVLSFLAFGGYLLMLIYQVFAVSSVVPLFPLMSSTIPVNPTLTGVLLGRSNPKIITYGRSFDENYINEVENIVKGAMTRVKAIWESTGESRIQVKGDLGH